MDENINKILELFEKKEFEVANLGSNSTEIKDLNRVGKAVDKLFELNNLTLRKGANFFYVLKEVILDYMKEAGYQYYVDTNDNIKFKRYENGKL